MAQSTSLEGSLRGLSVSDKQAKPRTIADSWEDSADVSSSGSDNDDDDDNQDTASGVKTPTGKPNLASPLSSPGQAGEVPRVPPPTPASPRQAADSFSRDSLANSRFGAASPNLSSGASSPRASNGSAARPEKTTAAATRMIAASLGLKAPKKTEEQRQYDRAARDNEIRRKARDKEEQKQRDEDAERAKKAIWDDD